MDGSPGRGSLLGRRWRRVAALAILVAAPLGYGALLSEGSANGPLDRGMLAVVGPVQSALRGSVLALRNTWDRYIALGNVARENAALRGRLERAQGERLEARELVQENARLRGMLGWRDRSALVAPVLARVVAVAPIPTSRSLRIDRGTEDRALLGSAVVHPRGVVGRIARASNGYADVMLLSDPNSSLDVLVQRSRARGRVRGGGGVGHSALVVEHINRIADVEPGDVLVTSGIGTVFPKGLPVATVLSVTRPAYGLTAHVQVEPALEGSAFEEVFVLPPGWDPATTFEESTVTARHAP